MTRRLRRLATSRLCTLLGPLLLAIALLPPASAEPVSARQIMVRATEAAGGDAWRYAETIHLTGHARLFRAGSFAGIEADHYEMRRVYPRSLEDANTGTGKFRLDAYSGERLLFRMSFDGERMYDQDGPVPEDEAESRAASSFGFSAARFALGEGFHLERMPDDQVEGHPAWFVLVKDPSGGETLFGIDQNDASIRLVAWDTPQGWHHRIYSDFYWVEDPGFRQPGRVRLYYDGAKAVDIRWTEARVNVPFDDGIFQLTADNPAP